MTTARADRRIEVGDVIVRHAKCSTDVRRYEVIERPTPQSNKTHLRRENGSVLSVWWKWESSLPDQYELVKETDVATV